MVTCQTNLEMLSISLFIFQTTHETAISLGFGKSTKNQFNIFRCCIEDLFICLSLTKWCPWSELLCWDINTLSMGHPPLKWYSAGNWRSCQCLEFKSLLLFHFFLALAFIKSLFYTLDPLSSTTRNKGNRRRAEFYGVTCWGWKNRYAVLWSFHKIRIQSPLPQTSSLFAGTAAPRLTRN